MPWKSSRFALDPRRHDFQTNFGIVLTLVTLGLFGVLSLLYGEEEPPDDDAVTPWIDRVLVQDDNNNGDDDADYATYSCHDLYATTPRSGAAQCAFARTCNDGEGIWASFVFCSSRTGRGFLLALLGPFVALWLVLLFRTLGSTAEDYFSPALEMFALKLRLPPRFAGVTLLALGNGAADVSATVSAVTADPARGYRLALGALTGAAMVIGAVVSAAVVLVAEGLPCRGALVRDVAALGLSVLIVWRELARGVVTPETVTMFLTLYVVFVLLVLAADVYHRAVVLPRQRDVRAERERQRQLQAETVYQEHVVGNHHNHGDDNNNHRAPPRSHFSHVLTAFSNYDNPPDTAGPNQHAFGDAGGMGVESDLLARDAPIMLHGAHGILARQSASRVVPTTEQDDDDDDGVAAYGRMDDRHDDDGDGGVGPDGLVRDSLCVDPNSMGTNTSASMEDAWFEGTLEVRRHVEALWDDVAYNGDLHVVSKYLLFLEFPVTLLRQFTVPLPCEGYYNRGMTALSLALSPLWMAYYLHRGFGVTVVSWVFLQYALVCVAAGVLVLRMAPQTPTGSVVGPLVMPNLWVATPVALYGFVIAAAWIDTVADQLVSVLDFFGICLKIPGPIVGLTILAWGNSMSDLSADITMARKGLANMAMTACFAGPLFNILVGLGFGFSSLAAQTGEANREVTVPTSAATGFLFIALNSVVILGTGLGFGGGMIPKKYGYIAVSCLSKPFLFQLGNRVSS